MKCEGCQKMFRLTELTSHPDGIVPNSLGMKKNKMLCAKCKMPKPDKNWQDTDEKEYPF